MGNPLELWERLSTPMKVLVGAAFLGIAVYAFIKFKSGGLSAGSSVSPSGSVAGGATDVSALLKGLGYDGSTTAASATGAPSQTAGQTAAGNASIPPAVAPTVSSGAPKPPAARYISITPWSPGCTGDCTLGNVASHYTGGNLSKLLSLNPGIRNPDVVQAGQKVRVA